MKRRATEIISNHSIGSSGETISEDLPTDYPVTALVISQTGANVTDEASLSEILAGIGDIEVSTIDGTPIKISATDLYYFNRDVLGKIPHLNNTGEATDNGIRQISLILPLNPKGVWDGSLGIAPTSKGKIKVIAGSDTSAGMDGRTLTVTALGVEGARPTAYMGMYQDSFTSVAGDNFRDIQINKVSGIMGAFAFMTTGREDLTTTDAIGIEKIGWAVSRSVREKISSDALAQLYSNIELDGVSDYMLLDLGLKEADMLPYTDNLQLYIDSGVAEAIRLYPLLKVKN